MSIVHMGTFLCLTKVRHTIAGHISDPKCRRIRRARTKDVRPSYTKLSKSLISKESLTGTANALRPRLKPLPEAEDP